MQLLGVEKATPAERPGRKVAGLRRSIREDCRVAYWVITSGKGESDEIQGLRNVSQAHIRWTKQQYFIQAKDEQISPRYSFNVGARWLRHYRKRFTYSACS